MNSEINPFRLNETTPSFYGTCVVMSRIHLYKKVNFVKNVTYEVMSRQRRYGVSYRWSIWTDRLSRTVFEILSFKVIGFTFSPC